MLKCQLNPMNSRFLAAHLRVMSFICQQSMSRFLFPLRIADLLNFLLTHLDHLGVHWAWHRLKVCVKPNQRLCSGNS